MKTFIIWPDLGREMGPSDPLGPGTWDQKERLVLRFKNGASRRSSNWEEENQHLSEISPCYSVVGRWSQSQRKAARL